MDYPNNLESFGQCRIHQDEIDSKFTITNKITEDNEDERILVGYDRRNRILDPSKFPNSPTGVIMFKINNEQYLGTGVLIYPMIVLTAAHNVYDKETNKYTKDITFTPGKFKNKAKFGKFRVLEVFVPEAYKKQIGKEMREDYAILLLDKGILKKCVGYKTGYFGLGIVKTLEDIKGTVFINGYPIEKCRNSMHEMWGMNVNLEDGGFKIKNEKTFFEYDIDTTRGQSGSGIVLKKGEENYLVIGVHIKYGKGTKFNEGIMITEERFRIIHEWILDALLVHKKDFYPELKRFFGIDIEEDKVLNFYFMKDLGINILKKNELRNCNSLILRGCEIGNKEIEILSKIKFQNLVFLDLSSNKIENEGIKTLAKMDLINLHSLFLEGNNIGEEGKIIIEKIRKKFKNINIFS